MRISDWSSDVCSSDLLIFDDERSSDRLSNHGDRSDLYRNALSQYCMAHDRDHIGAQMADLGLPVIPVLTPDEALESDHVRSRELVQQQEHRTEGKFFTVRSGLMNYGLVRCPRRPPTAPGER